MLWRRLLPCIVLALLVVSCDRPRTGQSAGTAPAAQAGPTARITLLHINDVHGQIIGYTEDDQTYVGGYARLATAVGAARQASKADRVFLIHAGDEFSRGDDLTTATHGQANITLINELGFDLWVPGNGDFYDGVKNLRARIAQGKFKTILANIIPKDKDKEPLAPPYVIEQAGPVKVAFIGLGFIHWEHPTSWTLNLVNPVKTARKLVPELRGKADIVIAITHIGLPDDREMASKIPGIDLIIGGHTHTTLPHGTTVKDPDGRPVLICQTGAYLQNLGQVELLLVQQEGRWRVSSASARLIPLDDKIKPDPAMAALIARLTAAQQGKAGE